MIDSPSDSNLAPNLALEANYNIGQDLYTASVKEMKSWITLLRHDISRLELEIEKKQQERTAAESIFNKPT